MPKKINLGKILDNNIPQSLKKEGYSFGDIDESYIINAMKEACKQTLELAAENAECEDGAIVDLGFEIIMALVNKQSILDTINQIE